MMVHIVPAVPPAVNGLADYAFELWQNWPAPRPNWGVLSANLTPGSAQKWPQVALSHFEKNGESLQKQLEKWPVENLVLHYVGYAYDRNGAPLWLAPALANWKKTHPNSHLTTMFHEVWAPGPFWRKHFWFLPRAKQIARELLQISDVWLTSCEDYRARLLSVGADPKKGAVLPVATNIEPAQTIDFAKNWPLQSGKKLKIAVFGQQHTRWFAVHRHKKLLQILCARKMVESITIMGRAPHDETVKHQLRALQLQIGASEIWKTAYDLPNAELSRVLATHDIGIVKDASIRITKSGVFAAFCAHGVLPVCVGENPKIPDANAPFVANFDGAPTLAADFLSDFGKVQSARQNVEKLATTALSWPFVAREWANLIL